MRTRVILPIIALLALLLVGLGLAVANNVSASTYQLIDKQLDDNLAILQSELGQIKASTPDVSTSNVSNPKYQALVDNVGVGDGGGTFVVGDDGTVTADSARVMIGQSVSNQAWFTSAKSSLTSTFETTFGQTRIYAHSVSFEGGLIVNYIPAAELSEHLSTPLYITGVMGIIGITIAGILIYFIITRLLIDPLESFNEQIKLLKTDRRIKTKPLRMCKELVATARQLNNVLDKITDTGAISEPDSGFEPGIVSEPDSFVSASSTPMTNFEFVELLRDVFEPLRLQITAKQLKFSLLVDKNIPEKVFAERSTLEHKLLDFLTQTIATAEPRETVQATVKLLDNSSATMVNDTAVYDGSVALVELLIAHSDQKSCLIMEVQKG
ncbi:MAG: hypothetical protein LBC35_00900 [Coriobacteriales bacterium]|jgi:hypothetical protein|nr:hypothetical protein [Coriobacteriales bacterium]